MDDIKTRDAKADRAIKEMVAAAAGAAVVPVYVNWSIMATAMGSGVIAIGIIYDVKLNADEAWKLVKQFFIGAGFWFLTMNVGAKILTVIIESTGIGYGGGVVLDAAISSAAAYAIGACAKEYFRRDFLGNRKLTKEELQKIFQDAFKNQKNKLGN